MDVIPGVLRRWPNWAYAARLLVLMIVVSAIGLASGAAVTEVTESPRWLSADRSWAESLHERTCETWLWPTALGLSVLGWPLLFYVGIGGLIAFLLWRRERALVAYFVITGLTGGVVDTVIKQGINRPRPGLGGCNVGLTGKSFPSGHLMIATLCYGMLLLALLPLVRTAWRRRALVGFVAFALLGSMFARSAVGAHYASDLIAGLLLGALWLAVGTWAYLRWRRETGRPAAVLRRDVLRRGVAPDTLTRLRPRPRDLSQGPSR